jgi:predicted aspartyl protease
MRGRYFCCLSLLTLLTAAGGPAARASREASTATVSFHLYNDYLIVAQGSAGPLKGLSFLVDTGSSPTVLDRRVARRLALAELPGSTVFISGPKPAGHAVVPNLEFGPIKRRNLPIMVEDLSFLDRALPLPIDAVIGLDVLGASAFEIDYLRGRIHFGSFPPLANSLPLRIQAGLPIIDAELNHVAVRLLMDTGAYALLLIEPGTARPVLPTQVSAARGSTSLLIGEVQGKRVWLHGLRLGEKEFGLKPAFMVPNPGYEERIFDGVISPAALGMGKVAIDVERGVVEFSR